MDCILHVPHSVVRVVRGHMTCTSTHTVDINCNENQSLGVWWVAVKVKEFQTSKWYCTKDERCAELCDVEHFSFTHVCSFLATIHHEIIYSLLD